MKYQCPYLIGNADFLGSLTMVTAGWGIREA